MTNDLALAACTPTPVEPADFNYDVVLPYGCTVEHVRLAMVDFLDFLGTIDQSLHARGMDRLESFLMPANFSSIVGEFMGAAIPRYCPGLVKNQYHNGHPDLLPAGLFTGNAAQYAHEGIEIKASRYLRNWQGHNAEESWLMVFVFDSNRPRDEREGTPPQPFRFLMVVGAQLTRDDWLFAGRSETSRRTITASVTQSGHDKMMANWVYKAPDVSQV